MKKLLLILAIALFIGCECEDTIHPLTKIVIESWDMTNQPTWSTTTEVEILSVKVNIYNDHGMSVSFGDEHISFDGNYIILHAPKEYQTDDFNDLNTIRGDITITDYKVLK